jgi:glycosyltransferase involved in cell wall biosynthesis
MANSRQLFAGKVLGHYLHYAAYKWTEATSWNIINRYLHPYLRRFGLIKQGHPDLIFAHPDAPTYQYLYTVWETSLLPLPWRSFNASYKRVLAPSRWNVELFKANGFEDVHYVPLGVESDVFQPWGPVRRFHEGRTFLWFARNQYRKGLDVMLNAWHRFHRLRPDAQLILMGVGIIAAMPSRPERIRRWSNFQVGEYPQDGICVYEIVTPVDEASLAAIYRSVDFTVCSSRSEGFGFPVAESMACGTPAIFGLYGGTCDFFVKGALSFNGRPLAADYSDMGFGDVGDWWEPDGDQLVARLVEAQDMNDATYRELATRGVQLIRARFSWRNTCIGVRDALAAEPERSQV